ncbi:MAG TPA: hypothetical protein DCO93_03505, partial [Clostridiales bacterium]|nr:hypothetical protein [Clostridiales bacterium]
FNGTFGNYDGSNYAIGNISGAEANSDREGLMSGGSYTFPDAGVTVDMSHLAPIAQQAYDAYSYGDGAYYSNGTSYYELYWQ